MLHCVFLLLSSYHAFHEGQWTPTCAPASVGWGRHQTFVFTTGEWNRRHCGKPIWSHSNKSYLFIRLISILPSIHPSILPSVNQSINPSVHVSIPFTHLQLQHPNWAWCVVYVLIDTGNSIIKTFKAASGTTNENMLFYHTVLNIHSVIFIINKSTKNSNPCMIICFLWIKKKSELGDRPKFLTLHDHSLCLPCVLFLCW